MFITSWIWIPDPHQNEMDPLYLNPYFSVSEHGFKRTFCYRLDKFMRGLERVMLVVSTTESKPVEPGQLLLFLLLLLYAEYIRCSFLKIVH